MVDISVVWELNLIEKLSFTEYNVMIETQKLKYL
jgi:hypothetical protein